MKRYETVQLNVKVDDGTADQIKKLAAFNHLTVAEQLRQFIQHGLDINSYQQNIDFIAGIIRQELMAIYQPDDIRAIVSDELKSNSERLEQTVRKSGKTSAAGYFLLVKLFSSLSGQFTPEEFMQVAELAGQMGVEYMKQSNRDINDALRDGETVCRMANL